MNWLNKIVEEVIKLHPSGEILIESGGSPSGTHHLGHMRELVISDAVMLELKRRGRKARHIYFVDDLDALRKIPINVSKEFEQYLGKPLCDVPAPDGSNQSYADYFLQGLIDASNSLGIEVEFVRSHEKYRTGFFVPVIERSLERIDKAKSALEAISGRKLSKDWTPIQVMEEGRLKNRKFVGIDTKAKTVKYVDASGKEQTVKYSTGEVKLDWRLDWPGRWLLMKVAVEPFGRDHATKGGSYDTGVQIMRDIYDAEPPYPIPYDFINMVGDTKKMSASKGTGLDAVEGATIMPPEVVRYFILKAPPDKRLYFDPINGVVQLMDEFASFSSKTDLTEAERQLLDISTHGQKQQTVSSIPFSHLVASYQSSLKDSGRTIEIIKRTEHSDISEEEANIIKNELKFIDAWLDKRAPDDVKFELAKKIEVSNFNERQKLFLAKLANKIQNSPQNADGEWFHNAIYDSRGDSELEPKEMFTTLYRLLINKDAGPRAGWFLSILPRDWLIKRLKLVQ